MLARWLLCSFVTLVTTVPLIAGNEQLSVTLEVEPSTVLVGLSPSLRISVTNDGTSPAVSPKYAVVRVTPENGESFIALYGSGSNERHGGILGNERTSIGPGERAIFEFRTSSITSRPEWFEDPRWLEPGTYRMQMLLMDSTRGISQQGGVNLESIIAVRAASREAVLTIEEPSGDDAIVWNALKEALHPRADALDPVYWDRPALQTVATEQVQLLPGSAYAPYIAGSVRSDSPVRKLEILHRIIDAHDEGEMIDEVWGQLAYDEMQLGREAELKKDIPAAIRWNDQARLHLTRLSKSSNADVKGWSTKQLSELPSAKDLQERAAEQ